MRKNYDILPKVRQTISAQRRYFLRGIGFTSLAKYYKELQTIRSGSKLSRVLRHIFEHKNAKRIFGSNLALMMLASSFVPSVSTLYPQDSVQNVYEAHEVLLTTDITIRQPLETIQVNQGYSFFHPAIDYEGDTGDPIYPIMSGRIQTVEYSYYAYGNSIVIDHQNGYFSRYAHLSKINVDQGDIVNTFTVIGAVGSTGRSTGDHLHLEVNYEGNNINPLSILPKF